MTHLHKTKLHRCSCVTNGICRANCWLRKRQADKHQSGNEQNEGAGTLDWEGFRLKHLQVTMKRVVRPIVKQSKILQIAEF